MRDKNERRRKSNDAKKGKEKVRYHSYLKILVSSSYCFVWYFCNQSRTLFSPILQKERGAAAAQWFPKKLTRSVSRNGIKNSMEKIVVYFTDFHCYLSLATRVRRIERKHTWHFTICLKTLKKVHVWFFQTLRIFFLFGMPFTNWEFLRLIYWFHESSTRVT